jgi:HlyD family secretion protein
MNPDEPKPEVGAAEPKSEAKATELKPEVKATGPQPEAAISKPEAKAAEPQLGVKAEPKPEVKAEPKTEVKPEPKPEHTPETKAESKPETKATAPKTAIRNKIIFALSIIGILAGLVAAYLFGIERKAQPPVFKPVSSPYDSAIYANGIIESDQSSGANINIYPEVSGPITQVLVREGQTVSAGTLLFTIDDSVPRANVELAEANLKAARDQYDKRRAAYDIDPKSISKDVLDTAEDAVNQAAATLKAANALLQKYSVKAPLDGVVLALNATAGSYVSSQGAYDAYTQGFDPLVVMGAPQNYLAVRCYVDEILVSRLPSPWHIRAQMSLRGTDIKVPLEFVRVQPYVSPKIELSNERQEQVDLRVLPVIFRFEKKDAPVYPGQLVDVYIGQQ